MIAPVQIRKDGELDKDELENYQKLANNGFVLLSQELAKDYKIVTEAEAGTMRLQVAITDADTVQAGPQYTVNYLAHRMAGSPW